MPEGYWNLFDEETTARLLDPHPNVVIETARDAEQFTEKASQADGAMVIDFGVSPELLKQDSRLRWVHSIRAGTEDLLTPELIAAEHVAFTASKGPHAPLIAEHMVLR
ncbi:MAG: hypothetical protein IID00_07520, partial [Chloroflexi bacterium]|nr:hypothetical protein [Chloroflexota bacterium]